MAIQSGRLDALQLVESPIKRSLDRGFIARQLADRACVFRVLLESDTEGQRFFLEKTGRLLHARHGLAVSFFVCDVHVQFC